MCWRSARKCGGDRLYLSCSRLGILPCPPLSASYLLKRKWAYSRRASFSAALHHASAAHVCHHRAPLFDQWTTHFSCFTKSWQGQSQSRSLWIFMSDIVKAFPRQWRASLLDDLSGTTRVRGGSLAALGDILSSDVVCVWLSGSSTVTVTQGIPEGGCLGPLLYPLSPDSLMRQLSEENCGYGIGVRMPDVWISHKWRGDGQPVGPLVAAARAGLRGECPLPPASELAKWPDLEASAARALDLEAPLRLAALFHADDPVFLGSSRGALNQTCEVMREWGRRRKTSSHVGGKSAVMVTPTGSEPLAHTACVSLHQCTSTGATDIRYSSIHRWLGILWPANLDFRPALLASINCADAAFRPLANLVRARAIPLHLAVLLFEAKLDAVMMHGRWLHINEESSRTLDCAYERWAKELLGGDPWRNGAVARSELGWKTSGFARTVQAVALRRARFARLPASDFYASVAAQAGGDAPQSWLHRSAATMATWGLPDFATWPANTKGLTAYKLHITELLVAAAVGPWHSQAATHRAEFRYTNFQTRPSSHLAKLQDSQLSWRVLCAIRGWSRCRAGYAELRHKNQQRSAARHQNCIFCGEITRSGYRHTFGSCPRWHDARSKLTEVHPELSGTIVRIVLGCGVEDPMFPAAVVFADEVDRAASSFWTLNK